MSENSKLSVLNAGWVPMLCSGFILKKDEKPHVNMSVKSPWKWEHMIHCLLMLWFSQNVKAVKWGGESGAWVSIQSGFPVPVRLFFFPLSPFQVGSSATRLFIYLLTPADTSASPHSDYLHRSANLSGLFCDLLAASSVW